MCTYQCTQVYRGIHGLTRVRIHRYTRIYTSIQEYIRVYRGINKYAPVYTSIRRFAEVYTSIPKYTQVYTSVHKDTWVYTSIHGYTQVYTGITRYTQVYTSIHGYTPVFTGKRKLTHVYTSIHKHVVEMQILFLPISGHVHLAKRSCLSTIGQCWQTPGAWLGACRKTDCFSQHLLLAPKVPPGPMLIHESSQLDSHPNKNAWYPFELGGLVCTGDMRW